MTKVIVCGYGKNWNDPMEKYIRHALKTASKTRAWAIIFSGGNTTNETNGSWKTEAEMMDTIAEEMISLTGKPIKIILEEDAYNTLRNLENSKRMINAERIIIVCNWFHLPKVVGAAIKVFGLKATWQRISFRPFLLTTGKIENLMILAKTVPEVLGYFIRPLGRRIEYKQWKLRTGRKEQLTYKEFCSKFIPTGELI